MFWKQAFFSKSLEYAEHDARKIFDLEQDIKR